MNIATRAITTTPIPPPATPRPTDMPRRSSMLLERSWSSSRTMESPRRLSSETEAPLQIAYARGKRIQVRDLALRRQPIHDVGEYFAQTSGRLLLAESRLRSDLRQAVPAEHLCEDVGGDRLVGAGADPGARLFAESRTLELVQHAAETAQAAASPGALSLVEHRQNDWKQRHHRAGHAAAG